MNVSASKKPVVDISFPEIEKFDHLPAPKPKAQLLLYQLWKVVVNIVVIA